MNPFHRSAKQDSIPARVRAAMEFLQYCQGCEAGDFGRVGLDKQHTAIQSVALEVMRLYFSGEMTFATEGSAPAAPGEPDDPEAPVPAQTVK